MSSYGRRSFLKHSALLTGGVITGAMQGLIARTAHAADDSLSSGYGPLVPVADLNTGQVLLHLPDGFSYYSFGRTSELMTDGVPTPGKHDGMAAFPVGSGRYRLVRNHEILPRRPDINPKVFGDATRAYDAKAGGGTTTIDISLETKEIRSWVSLNGTLANCGGGPMPWGSWVTGEECTNGPDNNRNFRGELLDLDQKHGYIFEVPSSAGPGQYRMGRPIRSAGRFNHEAAAYDPVANILYLTEDNFDGPSGFYRYLPPNNPMTDGYIADGGTLQMLSVSPAGSTESVDLRGQVGQGTTLSARWVTISDPDPTWPTGISNVDASRHVVNQGVVQGGARFSRLEGCWYGSGTIFFTSTQGGIKRPTTISGDGQGWGQVWAYDTTTNQLTLLVESPGSDVLDFPDNLTISPKGSLLICEDSNDANLLRGVTPWGAVFDFAINQVPGYTTSEWAGATFSSDGKVLFANIQDPGVTFAIWGPWARGPL